MHKKANLAAKIWDVEGFDYYFADYDSSGKAFSFLRPAEKKPILTALGRYLEAREDLQKALEDAGLGPNDC